jgi:Right handed beta helix region
MNTLSSRFAASLLAVPLAAAFAPSASADVIFVRANQNLPTALQNGISWGTAFKSLQSALAVAASGDEIWVAKGTYRPTTGTDRTVSFELVNGVHLIGGFDGVETLISQRDVLGNPTILSGDIGAPGFADNTHQVVRVVNNSTMTFVDGFTITGGNANQPPLFNTGSAVHLASARVALTNLTVTGNAGNVSAIASTGIFADRHSLLFGCHVFGNDCRAVDVQSDSSFSIVHSTIVGNNLGALYLHATSPSNKVSNSILFDNGSGSEEEQLDVFGGTTNISVQNSVIQGWDGASPSGVSTTALDPRFADTDGDDNDAGTGDDNHRLLGDSPAIDRGNTLFIGLSDLRDVDDDGNTTELYPFDLAGNPRRVDDPLIANIGGGTAPHADAGAFERIRPRTVFVDKDATGANNGTTWASAYTNLVDAINELNDLKFGGDGEIWVAEGTYTPHVSNPALSFIPGDGVHLYGGFIGIGAGGNELERSLRDWVAHPTTLSGELGVPGSAGNSTRVVRFTSSSVVNTILDGFRITGGAAQTSTGPGGGIHISNDASPTIRNCVITGNTTTDSTGGAGVFVGGTGAGTASIVQCAIVGNGGAASGPGAGILVDAENATISNCIVAGNTCSGITNGAGVHFTTDTSTPSIRNSILFSNVAGIVTSAAAQLRHVGSGTVTASSCAIQNLTGALAGITQTNCFAYSTSMLVDPKGPDGVFGTSDDDYHPTADSGLVDAGDTTVLPDDIGDLDSDGASFESVSRDFGFGERRVNMPAPDSGSGFGPPIDIGLFEFQPVQLSDPDFTNDGFVDAADLGILLGAWNTLSCEHDLNGDCIVDAVDLGILLGAWTN